MIDDSSINYIQTGEMINEVTLNRAIRDLVQILGSQSTQDTEDIIPTGIVQYQDDGRLTQDDLPQKQFLSLTHRGSWTANDNGQLPFAEYDTDNNPVPYTPVEGDYWIVDIDEESSNQTITTLGGISNWQEGEWVGWVGGGWKRLGGVAILDQGGKIMTSHLPFATTQQARQATSTNTVLTPKGLSDYLTQTGGILERLAALESPQP